MALSRLDQAGRCPMWSDASQRNTSPPSDETESCGKKPSLFERLRRAAPTSWFARIAALPKVYGLTLPEREGILKRNEKPVVPESFGNGNWFIIAATSLVGKLIVSKLSTLTTYRMPILYDAIEHRHSNVGLLTVSNHHSMLDDPLFLSSILPPRIFLRPSLMRVGMCSLDLCFQNVAYAQFCNLGKTRPMMRLGGLGQPYLKDAANLLSAGQWIHLFPQGRVCQHASSRGNSGYFKRGCGKILAVTYAQTGRLPIILPIYHEGMADILPQRKDNNKVVSFFPRVGQKVYAIAGDSVTSDVQCIVDRLMPSCEKTGGVLNDDDDSPECLQLYEEIADFLALSVRLLRAELRERARSNGDDLIGEPWEAT